MHEHNPNFSSHQLQCLSTMLQGLINECGDLKSQMRDVLDLSKDVTTMANKISEKASRIRAMTLSLQGGPQGTTCDPRLKQIAREIIRRSKANNSTERTQYLNSKYVKIRHFPGIVGTRGIRSSGYWAPSTLFNTLLTYDLVKI